MLTNRRSRLAITAGVPRLTSLVQLSCGGIAHGATRFVVDEEKRRRRWTALPPLHHAQVVLEPKPTTPVRHKNGTSYDGTVARNSQPVGLRGGDRERLADLRAGTHLVTTCCSLPCCAGLCQVVLSCLLLACSCYSPCQTIQLDTTRDNAAKPKLWPRIGQD